MILKVQGFEGSRVQEFKSPRVQGFKVVWVDRGIQMDPWDRLLDLRKLKLRWPIRSPAKQLDFEF